MSVPCCHDCRPRLAIPRLLRSWSILVVLVAATWAVLSAYDRLEHLEFARFLATNRLLEKLVLLVSVVLLSAPAFLLDALLPPPFDMTVHESSVDYEFRAAESAQAFQLENADRGAEPV